MLRNKFPGSNSSTWKRGKHPKVAMATWTSNFSRHKNPRNEIAGHSQASRRLGTIVELETRATRGVQGERTETPQVESHDYSTSRITRLRAWWSHNVRLNLEHGPPGADPRDYLALERTFLGWFRTSVTLISFGVVITQLFILKDLDPRKGKILGVIMSCGGILVVLLGCVRYFRQQKLLTQGKSLSGGWHHHILITLLLSILVTLFVFVIVDS